MSHSLSITPAEKKIDLIIRIFLSVIWVSLIIFGIITLIQPLWLQNISSMGRESEASDLKYIGDEYLRDGKILDAIDSYQAALETNPELQSAAGNMAIAYAQIGEYDKAKRVILKTVEEIPERAWIGYLNLGDIYRDKKDFETAMEYYLLSVESSPFPANGYMYAGYCSMQLKDWDKALLYYKKSLASHTDYKGLYRGSILRAHFSYRDDEESIEFLENELLKDDFEKISDRYDELTFRNMLMRNKDIGRIYNDVGIIYFNNQDYEQAEKFFREALRLDSGNRKARQNLSLVTQKVKNRDGK